jgi:hypothetical protein
VVPDEWLVLLGVSVGTTGAAAGITAARSSKGVGPVSPSFADFITRGGLVAWDRVQFLVWTLFGCVGLLAQVLLQDPSKLMELPDFPNAFLYLMGASTGGYLGGKVVRRFRNAVSVED